MAAVPAEAGYGMAVGATLFHSMPSAEVQTHCPLVKDLQSALGRFDVTMLMV
jgi:hypothetical protein